MSFTIPIGQISSNPVVGATSVSEGPVGYRTTIPRLLSVSRPVSWVTVNSAGPPYDGDTAATTSPGRSRPGLAVTLEFPIQSATVFHKSTMAALALRFEAVDRRKLAGQRPTTERLEPWTSHTDVSLRSLTWPHIRRKFTRPSHLGSAIAPNPLFSRSGRASRVGSIPIARSTSRLAS